MRTIDLTGPQGNAFALMGLARLWGKQLEKDVEAILNEMTSAESYDELLAVFSREFCEGPGAVAELEGADDFDCEDMSQ